MALTRPRQSMPEWVSVALDDQELMDAYMERPPYQRNDYLMWIKQAKHEETRHKRLEQMLQELRRGDVYTKMTWRPRS